MFNSPFQLNRVPIIPEKNDAIPLYLLEQPGDDECYTSGSVFSLVAAEANQMWLADYT